MFLKSGSGSLPHFHETLTWLQRKRKDLFNGLFTIIKHIPGLGLYFQGVHTRYQEIAWNNKASKVTGDIESLLPEEATFILVDEGEFIRKGFPRRKAIAFLERDGQYGELPVNDAEAIQEVETIRRQGAAFLIILWPAFWWLEYYKEWNQYIRSRFHCIEENERIIVFDLK
jgi:hypothetical protein